MFRFLGACLYLLPLAARVAAHVAAFGPGMYCQNSLSKNHTDTADFIVEPLYQLKIDEYWMHGCSYFPPPEGEFLEFPAGGSTVVELANNKGFTSMAFHGRLTSDWTDGLDHPEFEDGSWPPETCITEPNLHTQNQSMAQGTGFAIAYTSDIKEVTLNNLVVFSIAEQTPWKRLARYEVPADMPACPHGGCICTWGWVPGFPCGQPNIYMVPFRCQITHARTDAPRLAPPQVPMWCENEPEKCVRGAKQFLIWRQAEGNNVVFAPEDGENGGFFRAPAYNMKMGFKHGAQNDIFEPRVLETPTHPIPRPAPPPMPPAQLPVPLPMPPVQLPVPQPPTTSSDPPAPTTSSVPHSTGIQPPSTALPTAGSSQEGHGSSHVRGHGHGHRHGRHGHGRGHAHGRRRERHGLRA